MVKITRLGHASFRINTKDITLYIDPYKIEKNDVADFIFITHSHFDHCSPEDVEKINGPDTIIICPADCKYKMNGNITTMKAFEKLDIDNVMIETIPAHNENFHPKANGWLGYVIEIDGKRIYHAGDTQLIPEMKQLKDIHYALLPVGGRYTMDCKDAAEATNMIKPKIAIPMHYGSIVGSIDDAEKFKKLCKCKVEII